MTPFVDSASQLFNCHTLPDARIEKFVRRTNTNSQYIAQVTYNRGYSLRFIGHPILAVPFVNRLVLRTPRKAHIAKLINYTTFQFAKAYGEELKYFLTPFPLHEIPSGAFCFAVCPGALFASHNNTNQQMLFTWKPSPLRFSNFSFEYLLEKKKKLAAPKGVPERSPSSVLTGPCDG